MRAFGKSNFLINIPVPGFSGIESAETGSVSVFDGCDTNDKILIIEIMRLLLIQFHRSKSGN